MRARHGPIHQADKALGPKIQPLKHHTSTCKRSNSHLLPNNQYTDFESALLVLGLNFTA